MRKIKGFTLIELLVVIAIIGILATIIIINVSAGRSKANNTTVAADLSEEQKVAAMCSLDGSWLTYGSNTALDHIMNDDSTFSASPNKSICNDVANVPGNWVDLIALNIKSSNGQPWDYYYEIGTKLTAAANWGDPANDGNFTLMNGGKPFVDFVISASANNCDTNYIGFYCKTTGCVKDSSTGANADYLNKGDSNVFLGWQGGATCHASSW